MEDDELMQLWPRLRIDPDNVEYFRGLAGRRLLINRCDDCATWHHPPRAVCSSCWSREVTPSEVGGTGTIALTTILRQGPREPGVDYSDGYPLVAVELDEQAGLRLAGTVIGHPVEQVRPGRRVRIVWPADTGLASGPDIEIVD